MWNAVQQLVSPKASFYFAKRISPWLLCIGSIALMYGLYAGLYLAPPDYQQGDVYRIIYIHVPSAIMSMFVYMVMAVSAFIFLIWKVKVADAIAAVSASIGACFTFITLMTGSIWGKPTWGTWWIWDARLTSELILLFIYFGIMAMRSAVPERHQAAILSNVLTLIGAVNIPIIHYSVVWWNTLHQGASILKFSSPDIAPSMLHPLLAMILFFVLYYFWLLTIKIRYEILEREKETQWVRSIL